MASPAQLLLASGSPRRAELLRRAGFNPTIEVSEVDESPLAGERPADYVLRLAALKCNAGLQAARVQSPEIDWIALAADTTVVAATGALLGKPESADALAKMLGMLSGATHQVLTGWSVRRGTQFASGVCTTSVTMRAISAAEIQAYWRTGEPQDKAGGYAIQGLAATFVSAINGSYSNVVGLPIHECATALEELGIKAYWK